MPRLVNQRIDAEEQLRLATEARLPRPQDLPDLPESDPLGPEWNAYKRAVGWLLAEGFVGRVALVHGGAVHSTWETMSDALQASQLLFDPAKVMVQEIQPYLIPFRWGYSRLCPS
jgi:hypothetical protein